MLLVAALYFGQQVYDIIFVHDNVANFMHIVGGLCGTAFGYYSALHSRRRPACIEFGYIKPRIFRLSIPVCKFFKISLCPQWVQRFRRLFVLENFTAFAGLRRLCNAL